MIAWHSKEEKAQVARCGARISQYGKHTWGCLREGSTLESIDSTKHVVLPLPLCACRHNKLVVRRSELLYGVSGMVLSRVGLIQETAWGQQ